MNEQVLVYEIKSSADQNAKKLFSSDRQYFYWNHSAFKNINIGDYVLVVNYHSRFVLLTKLDATTILTSKQENSDITIFSDLGETYSVSGKKDWPEFIRLKVLEEIAAPNDWRWKNLGSSETTYLNGKLINPALSTNRLKNIEQLRPLSENPEFQSILDSAEANFSGNITLPPPRTTKKSEKYMAPKSDRRAILTAIKTKPFLLLAGISGTGKSRLVRTLAFQTCADEELRVDPRKPGNFEMIPVKPNWHDSTDLMGYITRINGEKYLTTLFLKFIAKAWRFPEIPFFLCLDEMNLAPVEQYFAEYLSIIETRSNRDGLVTTDYLLSKSNLDEPALYHQILEDLGIADDPAFIDGIAIPSNLVVIGTVNMDETTHSFSRKVLDRAMTFEMNTVDLRLGLDENAVDWAYPNEFVSLHDVVGDYTAGAEVVNKFSESELVLDYLQNVNNVLEGSPFKIAYRVRDEFLIYCYHASQEDDKSGNWLDAALDEMTVMKILARIEGDEAKTGEVIAGLENLAENKKLTKDKLLEMRIRLNRSGYTSFWS